MLWPAGDTFLVYPGSRSSIRFEKLREGIVDFEKIRLVRERAAQSADAKSKELVGELDRYVTAVSAEREFVEARMRDTLAQAMRTLAALSERLAESPQ